MLIQNERPYINEHRPELRRIILENWDNLDVLLKIKTELQFRNKRRPILNLVAQIEKRLQELESFRWVSTKVNISGGKLSIIDWEKTGLLSAVGYKTGINGLDEKSRRNILDSIYFCEIPKTFKITELDKWGKPETGTRLKKLADCLASFTRNEKRNYTGDYSISISEREADLRYLKREYYDGKYDFGFPNTDI